MKTKYFIHGLSSFFGEYSNTAPYYGKLVGNRASFVNIDGTVKKSQVKWTRADVLREMKKGSWEFISLKDLKALIKTYKNEN